MAAGILSISALPTISNSIILQRNSYFLESTNNANILNVINIIQESQNYCVLASIQMILNYFEISLRHIFKQEFIQI